MRGVWLLACLPTLACSGGSGVRPSAPGSPSAAEAADLPGDELIPAEWTVSEDTSEAGDVITASVQLPAAKDIQGLLSDEIPRLVLRCVNGRVEASIVTESADTALLSDTEWSQDRITRIQLDSAPPCE